MQVILKIKIFFLKESTIQKAKLKSEKNICILLDYNRLFTDNIVDMKVALDEESLWHKDSGV